MYGNGQCNEAMIMAKLDKEKAISVAANPKIWVFALHYAAVLKHHHRSVITLRLAFLSN